MNERILCAAVWYKEIKLKKEKISELLYWLYEELSSRIGISQEEKFEWNTMGIKLFRLKKYKKYWEPRGIRYRI